jgi:hypothetical protein
MLTQTSPEAARSKIVQDSCPVLKDDPSYHIGIKGSHPQVDSSGWPSVVHTLEGPSCRRQEIQSLISVEYVTNASKIILRDLSGSMRNVSPSGMVSSAFM